MLFNSAFGHAVTTKKTVQEEGKPARKTSTTSNITTRTRSEESRRSKVSGEASSGAVVRSKETSGRVVGSKELSPASRGGGSKDGGCQPRSSFLEAPLAVLGEVREALMVNPADRATAHLRNPQDGDGGAAGPAAAFPPAGHGLLRCSSSRSGGFLDLDFGLPTLEEAGYIKLERPAKPPGKKGGGGGVHHGSKHGKKAAPAPPAERPLPERPEEKARRRRFAQLATLGLSPCMHKTSGQEGMLLSVSKAGLPEGVSTEEVKALLARLSCLDHINVANLLEVCEDEFELHLVYERCEVPLFTRLQEAEAAKAVSEETCAQLSRELLAATAYLAEKGLHQLDWSMFRIWTSNSQEQQLFPVKLFGVGLAGVIFEGPRPAGNLEGKQYFVAPELLERLEHHHRLLKAQGDVALGENPLRRVLRETSPARLHAMDVWAIGIVAYTVLAGRPPHFGGAEEKVLDRVRKNRWSFQNSFIESVEAKAFLEKILKPNPAERPRAEALLKDHWLVVGTRGLRRQNTLLSKQVVENLRGFSREVHVKRLLGRLLAEQLSPEEMSGIEGRFRRLDLDGNGTLNVEDLQAMAQKGDVDAVEFVEDMMAAVDWDMDQQLSITEFASAMAWRESADKMAKAVRRAFNALDADQDGVVTPLEMYTLLRGYTRTELQPKELVAFIQEADVEDMDRELNFDEFMKIFPQQKAGCVPTKGRQPQRGRKKLDPRSFESRLRGKTREHLDAWQKEVGKGLEALREVALTGTAPKFTTKAALRDLEKQGGDVLSRVRDILETMPRDEGKMAEMLATRRETWMQLWAEGKRACDEAAAAPTGRADKRMDSTSFSMGRIGAALSGVADVLEQQCIIWVQQLIEESLDLEDAVKHREWDVAAARGAPGSGGGGGSMPPFPTTSRGVNGAARRLSTQDIAKRIKQVGNEPLRPARVGLHRSRVCRT